MTDGMNVAQHTYRWSSGPVHVLAENCVTRCGQYVTRFPDRGTWHVFVWSEHGNRYAKKCKRCWRGK